MSTIRQHARQNPIGAACAAIFGIAFYVVPTWGNVRRRRMVGATPRARSIRGHRHLRRRLELRDEPLMGMKENHGMPDDPIEDLKRELLAILTRWGIKGLAIRLGILLLLLELIFVALPWAWHRWA